ncbi:pantoate--beta-alanine ligase [Paraconexibacter antarcticus]|uniref:Pantothenate synthetase n=1 Tax=Paraconexibacter antarcticus TaxID=2949664 RepID=A0ABY5DP06_9ACTN|nr:pantoate--beta-alanine ligase [Paraconexibacter antarcticus]UTI62475.1 pantoate--beta-alanine ligase [Paraconexibacter antarcticus]
MRTLRTVPELRTAVRAARRQAPHAVIGLVPTMGALHDGHLQLIRQARLECELVVVSLFVNPTQFDAAADLAAYPRDEQADAGVASEAGADFLFAPRAETVYPDGFSTSVQLSGPLVESLEGAHRGPGHFSGVTTVVTKLFNMVQPDVAYFGQKDAQQVLVIRKLVADLDLPVRIEAVPTVREPDGLARSSRNVHLSGTDRTKALALRAGLAAAEHAFAAGERDATTVQAAAVAAMTDLGVTPEYLALVDPQTLAPVTEIADGTLVAVAAPVGTTRLIDNTILGSNPNGRR